MCHNPLTDLKHCLFYQIVFHKLNGPSYFFSVRVFYSSNFLFYSLYSRRFYLQFILFVYLLFVFVFFSLLVYFIHYLRNDVTTFSTEFHIFYKIFVFFYLLKTNTLFLILLLALICYSYTFYNKNNYFIIVFFIYFLFGFIL